MEERVARIENTVQAASVQQELINEDIQNVKQKVEETFQKVQYNTGTVLQNNIERADALVGIIAEHIQTAEQKITEQTGRLDSIIVDMNAKNDQMGNWSIDVERQRAEYLSQIESKFSELELKCRAAYDLQLQEFANVKQYVDATEARILKTGVSGGAGTGSDGGQKGAKLSAKDVRVEKLSEKADTAEFRKWQKTIEIQLEHVFKKEHMEDIIGALRHERTTVTEETWRNLLTKLTSESNHRFELCDWDFDRETRWLYSYVFAKLNTTLSDLVANVTDQNGLEVFRLINDHMDKIPENAAFHMNMQLGDVVRNRDGTWKMCKGIVETSATVRRLDSAAQTYKKVVGSPPAGPRLIELLWQVMDPETKVEAKRKGIDANGSYHSLCIEIKDRLTTLVPSHAHIGDGRDKPDIVMGISGLQSEQQPPPAQAPAPAGTGKPVDA